MTFVLVPLTFLWILNFFAIPVSHFKGEEGYGLVYIISCLLTTAAILVVILNL